MTSVGDNNSVPQVSLLMPTYNRVDTLGMALKSALGQDYGNLQIIVINDGGQDVSGIVNSFGDPRILFIDRKENRGKAYSLNEALRSATGKYIAYLDDDDILYSHHVSTLVNALESNPGCGLAYSDLYNARCKVEDDGSRKVVSKTLEISRDFDRFFMLYYNHVLHVSMMHRRDLLEKTGVYNEEVKVLIDWDIARRMCFFTNFCHTTEITGEYYSPVEDNDRISVQKRKDHKDYLKNLLRIRTTRPAKPWPKVKDLSIIYVPEVFDKQAGKVIGSVWRYSFYPYKLYVPISHSDMHRLDSGMPNMIPVGVDDLASFNERFDAALAECEGELICLVFGDYPIENMWAERTVYALLNCGVTNVGYYLENSDDQTWSIVAKKEDVQRARNSFSNMSVLDSMKAAGVGLRHTVEGELPYKIDSLLKDGTEKFFNGMYLEAAGVFEGVADKYHNEIWMRSLAAKSYFAAGYNAKAKAVINNINRARPTVDTLLLEAKILKKQQDYKSSIELLRNAENILEGNRT